MDEYKGLWRRIQSELRIKSPRNIGLALSAPSFKSYVDLSHLEDFHLERDAHLPDHCDLKAVAGLSRSIENMFKKYEKPGNCGDPPVTDKEQDFESNESKDANGKSTERNSNLLCGYLNKMKLGTRYLTGKMFKRRWFVMADDTCTLLYYSTPRDQIPLGQIDFSKAVIVFDLNLDLNIFEVRTPDKAVLLQADDSQTMMYWIQNLQRKRKKFYLLKELSFTMEGDKSNLLNSSEFQSILKKVDRPMRTVGESAATINNELSRSRSFRDISLSKLRVEFQNKFIKLKSITANPANLSGQGNTVSTTNTVPTTAKNDQTLDLASPSQHIDSKDSKPNENLIEPEVNQDPVLQGRGAKFFGNFKSKQSRGEFQSSNNTNQNPMGKKKLLTIFKGNSNDACSECSKLQGTIEEMKTEERMLSDELMATHIGCRNLRKALEKTTRDFDNWKKLQSSLSSSSSSSEADKSTWSVSHEECLGEIARREERIVEMEDILLTMQSELVVKNDLIKSLKSKLESDEDDIQNLKDNLKLKDEMLNFLSDKCLELSNSNQTSPKCLETDSILAGGDRTSSADSCSLYSKDSLPRESSRRKSKTKDPPPRPPLPPFKFREISRGNFRQEEGSPKDDEQSRAIGDDGLEESRHSCFRNSMIQEPLQGINSENFSKEVTNLLNMDLDRIESETVPHVDGDKDVDGRPGSVVGSTCGDVGQDRAGNDSQRSNKENSESGSWVVYSAEGAANEIRTQEKREDERVAYKTQNQMLNQEILDLNEILVITGDRLDKSQIRITQLEAMYYQLQGKHLKCLDEILNLCSEVNTDDSLKRVKQFVDEYLQQDPTSDSKMHRYILEGSNQAYDQYGFEKHLSQQHLNSKTNTIDIQVKPNLFKSRPDLSLSLRWDTTLISLERGTAKKSPELKMMIREGVPNQFRARLWKICIEFLLQEYRNNSVVKSYSSLLDMINTKVVVTPAANQIELDLLRTLPNNKHFSTLSSAKVASLRNILLAFSIHNPEVGYCQGLNRLAAILLLFLTEEESFWGLVAMVEIIMPPKYYSHTLIAAHADQRVLKEFVSEKLPVLVNHFAWLSFDLSLFTFSWFLTVFVDNMPVNTFLRIWDTFLYEGSKVLFRYAVAIMKFYEDQMLSHRTAAEMNMFVRSMCEGLHDVDRLSQIAFNELNPFSMKKVRNKRNIHLQKLMQELQELDKLRHSFESSMTHQPRKNLEFKRSNASNVSSDEND